MPTPGEFADTFGEVIRVGLNWKRFLMERWPVELVHLCTPADLQRCFMPWYIGVHGEEVNYDSPQAVPMRLTDVPKSVTILNAERQADIAEKVSTFREETQVIEFAAPTYALPENEYFVLDGNHRLSALSLANVQFDVTLWNICGPLDAECLLDLLHWAKAKS